MTVAASARAANSQSQKLLRRLEHGHCRTVTLPRGLRHRRKLQHYILDIGRRRSKPGGVRMPMTQTRHPSSSRIPAAEPRPSGERLLRWRTMVTTMVKLTVQPWWRTHSMSAPRSRLKAGRSSGQKNTQHLPSLGRRLPSRRQRAPERSLEP